MDSIVWSVGKSEVTAAAAGRHGHHLLTSHALIHASCLLMPPIIVKAAISDYVDEDSVKIIAKSRSDQIKIRLLHSRSFPDVYGNYSRKHDH